MDKYLMGDSLKPWKGGVAQSITFVITQDCNLRCKYCYMTMQDTQVQKYILDLQQQLQHQRLRVRLHLHLICKVKGTRGNLYREELIYFEVNYG